MFDVKELPKSLFKRNGAPKGDQVFLEWSETEQQCFHDLRDIISGELVLALPDLEKLFILTTDASEAGYGAVLEQDVDGEEAKVTYSCAVPSHIKKDVTQPTGRRVIAYFSRSYSPAQSRYSTTEKELMAVVMAIEHFHNYLYGSKFKLYTDHKPLTSILDKKRPNPRVKRWAMRIGMYSLEICYKPGNENIVADMLSRLFEDPDAIPCAAEDFTDRVVATIEAADSAEEMNESGVEVCDEVQEKDQEEVVCSMKDRNIEWIAGLIRRNGKSKPVIRNFANDIQKALYQEYDNLVVVNQSLYRRDQDRTESELMLMVRLRKRFLFTAHLLPVKVYLNQPVFRP